MRATPQTLTREEAILALALIEEEYLELVDALFPDVRDDIEYGHEEFTPVEKLKFEQRFLDHRDHTRYAPDLVAVADALAFVKNVLGFESAPAFLLDGITVNDLNGAAIDRWPGLRPDLLKQLTEAK